MNDRPREAPIFPQCMALYRWIAQHFNASSATLARTLEVDALRLLDHVTLALKNFDRERHVEEADAALLLLRVHLRLAHELGLLDARQLVHVTGEAAEIGRQIGGWQKRLASSP